MRLEDKYRDIIFQSQIVVNVVFCAGFILSAFPVIFYVLTSVFVAASFISLYFYGVDFYLSTFNYKLFLGLAAAQLSGWSLNIWAEYYSLDFNFYDTGWFSNTISNFRSGYGFYNSELEGHEFSDHFTPNILLFSPFYSYIDSGVVLIIFRLIFFALSFYTIYRYCKFKSIGEGPSAFILFFWSISLGVNNYLGYEFQPSSLIIPFVFLLFELIDRKKYLLFLLVSVFVLGFKENSLLLLFSIGLYRIFFHKDILTGGLICSLAGITAVFLHNILMPLISGLTNANAGILDPFCCLSDKLFFLLLTLASTGFVLMFNLRSMLVLIPSLAVSILGNRSGAFTFTFHYQDLPMAISFCLMIHIFHKYNQTFWPSFLWTNKEFKIFTIILFVGAFFLHSSSPLKFFLSHKPTKETRQAILSLDKFSNAYLKLPYWKSSKVYAQDCLAFNLSRLHNIKSLKGLNQLKSENRDYFIVLCDYASGRWPIDQEYEPLKNYLRQEVDSGRIAEHKNYWPLLVFERKNPSR